MIYTPQYIEMPSSQVIAAVQEMVHCSLKVHIIDHISWFLVFFLVIRKYRLH